MGKKLRSELKMTIKEKLAELNLVLPPAPPKGGVYSPAVEFGNNLVYLSGCGPAATSPVKGKLGRDFSVEEGKIYARDCVLNLLAVLEANVGLDKVKRPVKLLALVNCTDDFEDQPAVANGGSQLLVDIFGAENAPSRSAIGCNALPGGIPVEIEAIFELN
jgi:enamine deaminase RidA (YjgF/YER057c/UK114 family)